MKIVNTLSSFANQRRKEVDVGSTPTAHKRFLRSGNWAEHDHADHSAALNAHGVEAARRFSIPR